MRPIDKGPVPILSGRPKKVSDYKDWREDLMNRLGNCCCYCNMPLTDSPQVEHVSPKNPQPGQTAGSFLEWENMVLACGPCNRFKSNQPTSETLHYLAEFHNTHLVFEYVEVPHPSKPNRMACIPQPRNINAIDSAKAKATIELCKLGAIRKIDPRCTDMRWYFRHKAFLAAKTYRQYWDKEPENAATFLELMKISVLGSGFFSVWMQIFADIPEVCQALIQAFPGTAQNCFDPNGNPIPRNGSEI
ncbi:MAG: HNH endonuclease [Bacteroidetes bacterium]|nr:HNH endonuclease [Bacteroidota bacterium]